ncbi:MAG: 2-hydroxyhepta-2,4-diene,7-dioate isomerase [Polaromonas sp.]|nr:2-hydroxyhepta-2,4-diene,7-dioate isomerase [Polaromonas sp.]
MRICRFNGGSLGLVRGDQVVDVTPVLGLIPAQHYPLPQKDLLVEALPQLRSAIEAEALKGQTFALEDVKFESPVANPGKIIGAPINYKAHVEESKSDAGIGHGRAITSIGDWGMFLKAGTSLIGCSDDIVLRFPERRNDHEVELGVVIGKQGNQIAAADAMSYIAGYTVALDMTLRGPEFQCFRKSIDSYSVVGPWLVTPDEVPDPNALGLWLTVNGEARQKSNTSFLVYDIARLIEFASSFYTLMPGDIIMSGTPEGVGPVKPGDLIEAGVESIGHFSIRVAPAYA